MPVAVFLRAVNVGGHQTFSPKAFALKLGAINIGAAGTFVLHRPPPALRTRILRRLPFGTDVMICTAREILDVMRRAPAGGKPFVSILLRKPVGVPKLPILYPSGKFWSVRVASLRGRCILSVFRRTGKKDVYPNEAVEKLFGVPATTRAWSTMIAVSERLRENDAVTP